MWESQKNRLPILISFSWVNVYGSHLAIKPQTDLSHAFLKFVVKIYARVAARLAGSPRIRLPRTPEAAYLAPTSIQFIMEDLDAEGIAEMIARTTRRGVPIKWFGAEAPEGFTSRPDHWRYIAGARTPPRAAAILARLCDVRLPLQLTDEECDLIGDIIADAAGRRGVAAPNQ